MNPFVPSNLNKTQAGCPEGVIYVVIGYFFTINFMPQYTSSQLSWIHSNIHSKYIFWINSLICWRAFSGRTHATNLNNGNMLLRPLGSLCVGQYGVQNQWLTNTVYPNTKALYCYQQCRAIQPLKLNTRAATRLILGQGIVLNLTVLIILSISDLIQLWTWHVGMKH